MFLMSWCDNDCQHENQQENQQENQLIQQTENRESKCYKSPKKQFNNRKRKEKKKKVDDNAPNAPYYRRRVSVTAHFKDAAHRTGLARHHRRSRRI